MEAFTPAIEAILFAAGESVPLARLSLILGGGEGTLLEITSIYAAMARTYLGLQDAFPDGAVTLLRGAVTPHS